MKTHDDSFYEQYALICKTIVNPVRMQVIEIIQDKTMNVSEILAHMDVSMSNLSNHLSALYRVGVLKRTKKGSYIYYSLADPGVLLALRQMRKSVGVITARKSGTNNED